MFLRSKLSILGLYEADNTLFNNLVLPVGVDKDTLIAEIISECADLEVLYPDSDYMKMLIGYWSSGMLDNWQKMFDALQQNYDPLNSYRKETTHAGDKTTSVKDDITEDTDETKTNSVKAYNENTNFVDYQKDVSNKNFNHDRTKSGSETNKYNRTVKGNIGIYSYAKLLTEEIELREKYDIYDIILADFKHRFILLVY